jgi:hypothetical protein
MAAATDADVSARIPTRPSSPAPAAAAAAWVADVGAAAFVFVTVANPPRFAPGTLDAWLVTTFPRERLDTGAAVAGFLCLVPLAALARGLLGRDRVLARIGSVAMPAGALLWVAGNLVRLAGQRMAGPIATHAATVDDALELTAFAALGVALLAFAGAAAGRTGRRAVPRAWCGYSLLLGAVLLALAGAHAAADGNLLDLLLGRRCPMDAGHLVAVGALLLPVWLVWTSRLLRDATAPQARNRA